MQQDLLARRFFCDFGLQSLQQSNVIFATVPWYSTAHKSKTLACYTYTSTRCQFKRTVTLSGSTYEVAGNLIDVKMIVISVTDKEIWCRSAWAQLLLSIRCVESVGRKLWTVAVNEDEQVVRQERRSCAPGSVWPIGWPVILAVSAPDDSRIDGPTFSRATEA